MDQIFLDLHRSDFELADGGLAVRAGDRDFDGDKVWIGNWIHRQEELEPSSTSMDFGSL